MQVGVVGLGHMGRAMAERLIERGFPLRVWNRTRDKADGLDATVCDTPADAADGCQVVITSLADDQAVREVVFDQNGVLEALRDDGVHVSASTISFELARELVRVHDDRRLGYLAAPVLGRPEAARSGQLFVLAGGDELLVEQCRPVFEAIGRGTIRYASPPTANLAKITVNLMLAGTIELLGEAIALGEKAGIEPRSTVELLTKTMFGCPAIEGYAHRIAAGEFEPAGFRMPLGLKDVELALAAGDALRVPLPVANVVRDHFIAALAHGLEDLDWSAVATMARADAGLAG